MEEGRLYGYMFKGLWKDIGKMEDYFELNKILLENLFEKGRNRVKGGGEITPPAVCGKDSFVGEGLYYWTIYNLGAKRQSWEKRFHKNR